MPCPLLVRAGRAQEGPLAEKTSGLLNMLFAPLGVSAAASVPVVGAEAEAEACQG